VRSLTIAVPSYQGRDDLTRLVGEAALQTERDQDGWSGVELVIVIDGSGDGSAEALEAMRPPLPMQVIDQTNAGPAAARNRCLEAAAGEITWFLDDDLVPEAGTLGRHRAAHQALGLRALLGPCALPAEVVLDEQTRQWWAALHASRTSAGRIEHLSQFPVGVANLSGPTELFRSIGGFDESFPGYGLEDSDFVLRLMQAGVEIVYDPEAVCWHHTAVEVGRRLRRRRDEGRNTARFVHKHPGIAAGYFPVDYPSRALKLLDRAAIRSPRPLAATARLSEVGHRGSRLLAPVSARARRASDALWRLALDASYLAGVAEEGPELLPMALGRPGQVAPHFAGPNTPGRAGVEEGSR